MASKRLTTGIARLDEMLGGGLIPGTMTVVMGATGIGKTQLGLHFANAGLQQENERGILFDLTSRGDAQNHIDYAARLFGWTLNEQDPDEAIPLEDLFNHGKARCDFMHLFRRSGRRVTRGDMDTDEWREWKAELAKKLDRAISFFYRNFVHGVRRCVIDGVEPADKASDSFQFHIFDYVYHQILHKESEWVARDLFRVKYRENADTIAKHAYDHNDLACLLSYTSHEVMLDDLLSRPIESGDVLSNANTIILMGKMREGTKMSRALHVAKHRGSACDDSIAPYTISEQGLELE